MKRGQTQYAIIEANDDRLLIKDLGPWDFYMTVTNAAPEVVAELVEDKILREGMRLFYFDSEGDLDEIVIEAGRFAGFRPGPVRVATRKT